MNVDGAITFSPSGRVSGSKVIHPSPPYSPVPADDLSTAARWLSSIGGGRVDRARRRYRFPPAGGGLGSRALAEQAWLVAHLDYARLGAVYDTFGDFDSEINGRADGLIGGVRSAKFTGFLRLEYALWHGQPQTTLVAVTNASTPLFMGWWPHSEPTAPSHRMSPSALTRSSKTRSSLS